jgi:hypothetical protein
VTGAPEPLHLLAHRAGAARQDESYWWGSPIETALAAVAAVRHHSGFREVAEGAVDRLVGWWAQEPRRRVSADTVAVALTAHAAHALARRQPAPTADAVERVADMARRDPSVVPELHVALAVWALDDLVPDRDAAPWPEVRDRLGRGSAYGVDEALREYGRAVAARSFDASQLVRAMLRAVPTSPSVTDGAAVAWVVSATVERCARSLRPDEPGLLALLDLRAQLVDRLSVDVSESSFLQPVVVDYDADDHAGAVVHLSSMEALLLDCALASRDPATPWVTLAEAHSLLGEDEQAAQQRAARWQVHAAAVVVGAGVFATLSLVLALARYDVADEVARAGALACGAGFAAAAAAVARPAARRQKLVDATGRMFLTLVGLGVVLVVNALLPTPFIAEAVGFAVSLALGAGVLVVWLLLTRDE